MKDVSDELKMVPKSAGLNCYYEELWHNGEKIGTWGYNGTHITNKGYVHTEQVEGKANHHPRLRVGASRAPGASVTRAIDRFIAKLGAGYGYPPKDCCWIWRGATTRNVCGHGQFHPGGPRGTKRVLAHVWLWEYTHQRNVPTGMVLRHTCDNSLCCNPNHLVLGTQKQNVRDAIDRGRYVNGREKLGDIEREMIRILALAAKPRHFDPVTIAKAFGVHADTVRRTIKCRA